MTNKYQRKALDVQEQNARRLMQYMKSPLLFIQDMWQLQPVPEDEKFQKGRHITNHQHKLFIAVEKALKREDKQRITVRSGHGTGKSASLAMLILWYLFSFQDAQIPCTAPGAEQMYDVLWKEIAKWMERMPKHIKEQYEWTTSYIRMKVSPSTWFARARTARKESPEALAGMHGDHVLFIVDEASGVPNEIFNVAEGALTEENILVILIGNPTRTSGYFYDSHHSDKHSWQCLHFDSYDSPIVDAKFVNRIADKHGDDSDEYNIRVRGNFPKEDAIDDKGYVPLILAADIRTTVDATFTSGKKRMGIDPAGEGANETIWVLRDNFKARVVAKEAKSTSKSIAQKTQTLMELYGLTGDDVYVDNFGVGANVSQELALGGVGVHGVNVGDPPDDKERFGNLRAEAYFGLKEWVKKGGELVEDEGWEQLLNIKFKRNLRGKIQIMSKDEMRRAGIVSPDVADALSLTFVEPDGEYSVHEEKTISGPFDPFAIC